LIAHGALVEQKDGRRNRHHIRTDLPLPDNIGRPTTIGQGLDLLLGPDEPVDHDRRPLAGPRDTRSPVGMIQMGDMCAVNPRRSHDCYRAAITPGFR